MFTRIGKWILPGALKDKNHKLVGKQGNIEILAFEQENKFPKYINGINCFENVYNVNRK